MKSIALFFPILLFMLAIAIEVFIGIYVYRDSNRRGMNSVVWTLVAIFAPSLVGFIIYLLVRGRYSNLNCPQCNAPVTDQYVVCPKCGTRLKGSCPNCGTPVERDWKLCPQCTEPLPENLEFTEPKQPKDNLWKILIAIIAIPIIILFITFIAMAGFKTSSSCSNSAMGKIPIEFQE